MAALRHALGALGTLAGGSTALAHYSGSSGGVAPPRRVDGGLLFPLAPTSKGHHTAGGLPPPRRVAAAAAAGDGGLLFPSDAAAKPCPICEIVDARREVLWEDEHFVVARHFKEGAGLGYLFLIAKRHFQGPATMTAGEAAALGPVLRKCERALEAATGCDRVYTAALGSPAAPHLHVHMVPVFARGPRAAKRVTGTPFDAFLQDFPVDAASRRAADGAAAAFRAAMVRDD